MPLTAYPDDDSWTADHVDRSRSVDLGDVGLPGHGVAVVVTSSGEERYVLVEYDTGEADYWPRDWNRVAAHEVIK